MKTNYSAQTQYYTIFLCSPTQAHGKRRRTGNTGAGDIRRTCVCRTREGRSVKRRRRSVKLCRHSVKLCRRSVKRYGPQKSLKKTGLKICRTKIFFVTLQTQLNGQSTMRQLWQPDIARRCGWIASPPERKKCIVKP